MLFVDTSFWIALESSSDQYHSHASNYWLEFQQHPQPLVTTSYVLDETATYFNVRGLHDKAVEIVEALTTSEWIQFIHVDVTLFNDGLRIFRQSADKRYSLTDCISFVVMTNLKIDAALSFDKHFDQFGFAKLPKTD